MKLDLAKYPHLKQLAEQDPDYRKAFADLARSPESPRSKNPVQGNKRQLLGGVGTRVARILKLLGISYTKGCTCKSIAAEMNRKGPDWCEANIDSIVGKMMAEAKRRKFGFLVSIAQPIAKKAARKIVELAIYLERKYKAKAVKAASPLPATGNSQAPHQSATSPATPEPLPRRDSEPQSLPAEDRPKE